MIPNTLTNLVATFKCADLPGHSRLPIAAWDDDGVPLVASEMGERRRIQRADTFSDYQGIADDPHPDIVQIMPAEGWQVTYDPDDSEKRSSYPMVGWGLRSDGSVVALDTDSLGDVQEVEYRPNGQPYRIERA